MGKLKNIKHVKSIVAETGLQLQLVDNLTALNALYSQIPQPKQTVYYIDVRTIAMPHNLKHIITGGNVSVDGVIVLKPACRNISYGSTTESALRRFLKSDPQAETCDICQDENRKGLQYIGMSCASCSYKMCHVCAMKHTLTEENVRSIHFMQIPVTYQCPQCRQLVQFSFMNIYYHVMDELDEFSKPQRDALVFLSENDPEFKLKMHIKTHRETNNIFKNATQNVCAEKDEKRFKKGTVVKIQGLTNKSEWNEQTAVIIGDIIRKNGVERYPIKLKHSTTKALIKEENLSLIN